MNSFTLQIRELIEFAKVLKSEIVYIIGNMIYGTDSSFTYLKQVEYENVLGITLCYVQHDMNNFIKASTLDIVYENGILYSNVEQIDVTNPVYANNMNNLFNAVNMISLNPVVYHMDNIRGTEDFEYGIALKSTQGIYMYKINEEYILSIFKNLLPINKKDSVSVTIRDIDNYRFISRFIISKPKKVTIQVDIVYLKIK